MLMNLIDDLELELELEGGEEEEGCLFQSSCLSLCPLVSKSGSLSLFVPIFWGEGSWLCMSNE